VQKDDRHESRAERLDRNWIELIQELRVAQTGVQVLAGFLLTLPFSARFVAINGGHRVVYLVAFSLALVTVGLMTAPAALHRFLFGLHEKDVLVRTGDLYAKCGLAAMGLTLVTVVVLIFGVVVNDAVGVLAGLVTFVFFGLAWVVLPLRLAHGSGRARVDPAS
jgi:hypothetical protein